MYRLYRPKTEQCTKRQQEGMGRSKRQKVRRQRQRTMYNAVQHNNNANGMAWQRHARYSTYRNVRTHRNASSTNRQQQRNERQVVHHHRTITDDHHHHVNNVRGPAPPTTACTGSTGLQNVTGTVNGSNARNGSARQRQRRQAPARRTNRAAGTRSVNKAGIGNAASAGQQVTTYSINQPAPARIGNVHGSNVRWQQQNRIYNNTGR